MSRLDSQRAAKDAESILHVRKSAACARLRVHVALAVVFDREAELAARCPEPNLGFRLRTRVPRDVLKTLDAAEIRRRLHLRRVAADPSGRQGCRLGGTPGDACECPLETEVPQCRRIDTAGKLPEVFENLGQLVADCGQLRCKLRISFRDIPCCELELRANGEQVLLGAVV